MFQITVLYVGSSLLAPLKKAEEEINRAYALDLHVAAHNFGSPLSEIQWQTVEQDLSKTDLVFVIHVMDGENGSRLTTSLGHYRNRHHAVVVINCMPELMRQTRMGRLNFSPNAGKAEEDKEKKGWGESDETRDKRVWNSRQAVKLLATIGSWVGKQANRDSRGKKNGHTHYLKLVDRLPAILRLVPAAGRLKDVKNYLFLFCYFLQPTPVNIRSMLLYGLKQYVPNDDLRRAKFKPPEALPAMAIYHPDAPRLFTSFEAYEKWYSLKSSEAKALSQKTASRILDPQATIGLLLMRPQVVSKTTKHYDALIRAIEAEGLSVIPAISTLMDNREACATFFLANGKAKVRSSGSNVSALAAGNTNKGPWTKDKSRVSQIVSLTGFSFVGGPAMNNSEAAAEFLLELNRPYRSAISLDMQTIEAWRQSQTGLNPVQSGMQIAIPEIDGATEPFVYGGIPAERFEPVPLEDRCRRIARRLKHWNRLHTASREQLKLALVLFCFPPNKGNIGTAADLEVFTSVWDTLRKLKDEGYSVELPSSPDSLRDNLLKGNSESLGATTNVVHRMNMDEYRRLCPFVEEAENEWGQAPGRINSFGRELLIQGIMLGNIFVGVQPTFGYEGDPMRLMMAQSGCPHHGFLAFYTFLGQVFRADAVVHVGTHGALEFMPGKQVGLSGDCWPDRLIGELPNIYLYSVNNPSEGSIAKRRSYAELVSYLTPPIENAGLYKDLATLKDLVMAYRQTDSDNERETLFASIQKYAVGLKLECESFSGPGP